MVLVAFEPIPTKYYHFEDGDKPVLVYKEMNVSGHEKSTMRKLNKALTGEDSAAFDTADWINKPIGLLLESVETKTGKTFYKVEKFSALTKNGSEKVNKAKVKTDIITYDAGDPLTDNIPEWVKIKIAAGSNGPNWSNGSDGSDSTPDCDIFDGEESKWEDIEPIRKF